MTPRGPKRPPIGTIFVMRALALQRGASNRDLLRPFGDPREAPELLVRRRQRAERQSPAGSQELAMLVNVGEPRLADVEQPPAAL